MALTRAKLQPTPEMRGLQTEIAQIDERLPVYSMGVMWLLMFATVIDGFDRSLLSTVLEDVRRAFDLSDSQLGLLTGAYATLAAFSVLPFGILTDRMRRASLVAFGFVPWAFGMVWQGLAQTFAMMFVARMFLGLLEASNVPATNSLLGDYYPVRERSRIYGLWGIATIAGYAAGPIFGGLTAYWWGWRGAFIAWGIVGFFTGGVVLKFLPEPPRGLQDAKFRLQTRYKELRLQQIRSSLGEDQGTPTSDGNGRADDADDAAAEGKVEPDAGGGLDYRRLTAAQAAKSILRTKTVWFVLAASTLTAFSGSAMATWPATFYRRYHGMSVTGAGLVTGFNALAALIGIWITARIGGYMVRMGRAYQRIYLLAVCYAGSGIFWGLAFFTDFTPISLHFLVIGSIFATGPNALLNAILADVVNPHLRGRTGAAISIVRVLGTTAAPIVFGVIADTTGLRSALLLITPTAIVGAVGILPALRTYDPDWLRQQRESVRQHRLELAEQQAAPSAPA